MKCFKSILVICCIAVLFSLPACRPEIDDSYPELNPYAYNFSQIFEYFWHGMNRNYLYWDSEPSDFWRPLFETTLNELTDKIIADPMAFWDIMYEYYKPKFAALGSPGEGTTEYNTAAKKAKGYFKDMTYGILDGNFKIVFEDKDEIIPSQNRRLENLESESPFGASRVFFYSDLSENIADLGVDPDVFYETYNYVDEVTGKYLDDEYEKSIDHPSGFKIVSGTISIPEEDGIILYLSYNNGSLFHLINDDANTDIIKVYDYFLSGLEKEEPEIKGIILDLRGNTGSNMEDIGYFWGRMVNTSFTYSQTRAKSGEGRLDYSPVWVQNQIISAPSSAVKLKNEDAKIIILTDGWTSSVAELMTMVAKAHKNAKVIGTRTMGAASAVSGNFNLHNGGGFEVKRFINYVSGAETQNRSAAGDKKIYEGIGVEPDIPITMTEDDWLNFFGQNGDPKDKWLEAAIKEISS